MILFLDFDGVLHPFHRPTGAFALLPAFERVMRDFPEVDIVISSAWREANSLAELRRLFSPDIQPHIIDATPVLHDDDVLFIRELEILAWLRHARREQEAWVAIDDTGWFFSPGCRNLILVEGACGFNLGTERELRRRLAG